jgi:hypothetical protein
MEEGGDGAGANSVVGDCRDGLNATEEVEDGLEPGDDVIVRINEGGGRVLRGERWIRMIREGKWQ